MPKIVSLENEFYGALSRNAEKQNGSVFFESACTKMHQIVASIIYMQMSLNGEHRLSSRMRTGCGLHGTALHEKMSDMTVHSS